MNKKQDYFQFWESVQLNHRFISYCRLSAKLVRSQDGAAALRLWQEYLRHVQTFLAGSLPEDYDGLREAERLCEVHQNLLTSQQSVLASRQDPMTKDFTQVLQEQFNSLANLHNETLARIMDRHNEVCTYSLKCSIVSYMVRFNYISMLLNFRTGEQKTANVGHLSTRSI